MGQISVEKAVRSRQYYVYTLGYPRLRYEAVRPGKYAWVFYVGKGTYTRIFHHENEADGDCACIKCQVIRSIWAHKVQPELHIRMLTPDEDAAYDYERKLITEIGLEGLVNKTLGSKMTPREIRFLFRTGAYAEGHRRLAELKKKANGKK
jgi:hypothetical protein